MATRSADEKSMDFFESWMKNLHPLLKPELTRKRNKKQFQGGEITLAEATAIIKEEEFQLLDTNEEYNKFGKIQQVLTPVSISTNNSRENTSTNPRTPCRFFAQGTCNKGNNCTFLHVTSSGQSANVAGNATPSVALV